MDVERLSQIGRNLETPPRKKNRKRNRMGKSSAVDFAKTLSRVTEESASVGETLGLNLPKLDGTESLESLLDEIHEAGEALKRDAVFGPLNGYKKAVRCFLRYILDRSIEVDEKQGLRNPKTMQQKKYVMIRVVDEKLENLAASILKGQADQLEILRRVDEIHGLLVDLTG